MEEIIKRTVLEQERKTTGANKQINVFVFKQQGDYSKVILEKLLTTPLKGQYKTYNSASSKDRQRGYFSFPCLRSGVKTINSYRAVGCKAYVSFKIINEWENFSVIVQRIYDEHNDHNPTDPSEGEFHRICPVLVTQIEELFALGTKPDVILTECHKWAKKQGHSDLHSREYFVTPRDIDNVRTCMMRKKHFYSNDSQSVDALLKGPFQEHVLYYQPYSSNQELIIVLQTPIMKSQLEKHSRQIVFVDTTYCVNQYSFPLFTLVVKDDHGRGVPVAYAIVGNETQKVLEKVLEVLKKQFPTPPRAFMVDKDFAEINALSAVFPESSILLCWYHVLQAVNRWLSKTESGVQGESNTQKRKEIISFFCKLKACSTVEHFKRTSAEFCKTFKKYPSVCQYFLKNWNNIGTMWADYGRRFNHKNSDTNNVIERFFHRLKYQFLAGSRNRRLDDLLNVLLGKADDYFTVIKALQDADRVKNPIGLASQDLLNSVSQMIESGWRDKIIVKRDRGICEYQVPSQSKLQTVYTVCPAECYCSCPIGVRGVVCKHHVLLLQLTKLDSHNFPDLETQISCLVQVSEANKSYSIQIQDQVVEMTSMFTDEVFYASADSQQCTCCTFSFYSSCACLKIACKYFKNDVETVKENHPGVSVAAKSESKNVSKTDETVRKLQTILEIVKEWQTVPASIAEMISNTHDCILKAELETKVCDYSAKADNTDKSRRFKPLFPNRKHKTSSPALCKHEETTLDLKILENVTKDKEKSETEGLLDFPQKKKKRKH